MVRRIKCATLRLSEGAAHKAEKGKAFPVNNLGVPRAVRADSTRKSIVLTWNFSLAESRRNRGIDGRRWMLFRPRHTHKMRLSNSFNWVQLESKGESAGSMVQAATLIWNLKGRHSVRFRPSAPSRLPYTSRFPIPLQRALAINTSCCALLDELGAVCLEPIQTLFKKSSARSSQ